MAKKLNCVKIKCPKCGSVNLHTITIEGNYRCNVCGNKTSKK